MSDSADDFGRLLRQDARELIRLVEQSGLSELHVENGDLAIVIRRQPQYVAPEAGTAQAPGPEAEASPAAHLHTITAPVVGKFYRDGAGTRTLVPGHFISVGEQLGIIESMRVPHEIHATIAGEVVEVLVSDGQPVEYGQPLLVVRTDVQVEEDAAGE